MSQIINNVSIWIGLFSISYAASGNLRIAAGALAAGCVTSLLANK